jgi:hypothetical protein
MSAMGYNDNGGSIPTSNARNYGTTGTCSEESPDPRLGLLLSKVSSVNRQFWSVQVLRNGGSERISSGDVY